MSKVADYLQQHLLGEILTSSDVRDYFSRDCSLLSVRPAMVIYPRNENDIRKILRFTWQLAQKKHFITITTRGAGTDQTGAAIGSGIVLVLTAHLNRILELNSRTGSVIIEPGIMFGKLDETLHTHGRFIPAIPSSSEYSTVGGAVANNASGSKITKYGDFNQYIKELRVILSNGDVINTRRLSKKDLNRKLGLVTYEGEIYRSIDVLIEDNQDFINRNRLKIKNNFGYNLAAVKDKDGSFDLTPLLIGSQGTLGVISEITMNTEMFNPETFLMVASCDNTINLQNIVDEVRALSAQPSSMEMINQDLLEDAAKINPNSLKTVASKPFSKFYIFIEYDLMSDRNNKKYIKKVKKILEKYGHDIKIASEVEDKEKLWKLRDVSSYMLTHNNGLNRSVPIIGEGAVPYKNVGRLIDGLYDLAKKTNIEPILWGHVGEGIIHLRPRLNIAQVGDRQKVFRLLEEYNNLIKSLDGTISSEGNDGRLKAPYLDQNLPPELYQIYKKVKQIFDPYNLLNQGVKFGTSVDDLKNIMRHDYKLEHSYNHLPRN
jgi:FAD/FMN-containing dehydrogenase